VVEREVGAVHAQLERWLVLTALLFGASAIVFAARFRGLRRDD
jgi:hypothetical protein